MTLRKITALTALVISALSAGLAHADSAAAPQEVKNIVLVHGLYADGSSWGKVIPLLQAKGLHVTAVQNPTTSLNDDAAAVKRALAQQDGPVILVAHSYGGMVISQAGDEPEVCTVRGHGRQVFGDIVNTFSHPLPMVIDFFFRSITPTVVLYH
ncbi:MAG: alpha/beta hydrolase, partial [Pantoea sp. Pent]|nr:alpha/beta hydrolase [Pantoea sp. Pent]